MVITELDIGGAERAFVQVALGLSQRGWRVSVVSLRDAGPLAASLRQAGISVTALECGGGAFVRAIVRLRRLLKKDRPEVVLSFLHHANLASRLAARGLGIPAVVSGVRVADRRFLVAATEWLTRCCVDHYIAVSTSVAETHAKLCGIDAAKMSTIPNGVDVETISQVTAADRMSLGLKPDDFVILCAGRLSEQKSPMDVLKAVSSLVRSHQNSARSVKLLYVGDGPLRPALESEVQRQNLSSVVTFMGWRPDLISIMKAADVLVLSSAWEGAPNVVLEAQAAGLPVVASSVDGCRELIQDGVTGRLFSHGDIATLTKLLERQFTDPAPAREMAVAALESVRNSSAWNSVVDAYNHRLRILLERPPESA